MTPAPAVPNSESNVFGHQLQKRKKGRFWKGLGLLCLASVAGGLGFSFLTPEGNQLRGDVLNGGQVALAVQSNPDLLFDNVGDDHVNILLVGEDRNWTIKQVFNPRTGKSAPLQVIDESVAPRADTMLIASFDRTARAIRVISLPRDAAVRYKARSRRKTPQKLNSVYAEGGKDREERKKVLKEFLAEEMGIRIDRVAVIKLDAFTKLVDYVGGVYVNVDGALKQDRRGNLYHGDIDYEDKWGGWEVHLKPGKQWLDGEKAHGYVRFRYDREGDPGRIRRQQQVMQALVGRIKDKPLWEMPAIAREIRKQFNADLSDEEMASAAMFAKNQSGGGKISPLTPFGIYEADGDVRLNKPENEKLFAAIFGSSFDPKKFLDKSPFTERDDIGKTNNNNPAARKLLLESGLITEKELQEGEKSSILDAPVRVSEAGG